MVFEAIFLVPAQNTKGDILSQPYGYNILMATFLRPLSNLTPSTNKYHTRVFHRECEPTNPRPSHLRRIIQDNMESNHALTSKYLLWDLSTWFSVFALFARTEELASRDLILWRELSNFFDDDVRTLALVDPRHSSLRFPTICPCSTFLKLAVVWGIVWNRRNLPSS